jgi:membrane peptidoglycan carboxypeptidase
VPASPPPGDGRASAEKAQSFVALLKWSLLFIGLALFMLLLGQIAGFKFLQHALIWLVAAALALLFLIAGVAAGVKLLKLGYRLLASLLLAGVLTFSFFTGINVYAATYDGFINKALDEKLPPPEHPVYYARRGRDYVQVFDESERAASVAEVASSPIKLAVIAVEDRRINTRLEGPVDFVAFARAGVKTYLLGRRREGGSTLQVQVAKLLNGDLRTETVAEKLKQSLVALRIEQRFGDEDHDRLIALYLNLCQLDGRTVGVAAAAANLFGISDLRRLNISQAALLAGMLRSPSKFDPRRNPRTALERRNLVLTLMRDQALITEDQFRDATKEEIRIQPALKRFELFIRAGRARDGERKAA